MRTTFIFGDSIALGCNDTHTGGWAQFVSCAEMRKGNLVYNLSVDGDTSREISHRIRDEISARYSSEDRIRIILAFGINDASRYNGSRRVHEPHFRTFIQKITETAYSYSKGKIFVVGPTNVIDDLCDPVSWNDFLSYKNSDIEEYHKILASEVRKFKYIPMFGEMSPELLSDGVHPNSNGHHCMARKILKRLDL